MNDEEHGCAGIASASGCRAETRRRAPIGRRRLVGQGGADGADARGNNVGTGTGWRAGNEQAFPPDSGPGRFHRSDRPFVLRSLGSITVQCIARPPPTMRRTAGGVPNGSTGAKSTHRRRRRRKTRPRKPPRITCGTVAVVGLAALVFAAFALVWLTTTAVVLRDTSNAGGRGNDGRDGNGADIAAAAAAAAAGGGGGAAQAQGFGQAEPPRALRRRQKPVPKVSPPGIQAATTNEVVEALMRLAQMSSAELRQLLEPPNGDASSNADNPFLLPQLRKGQCPWSGDAVVQWLPQRPPLQPSEWFRNRGDESSDRPVVAVYYEHLSKAGGTSFCKVAIANMPRIEVPRYYCMPSEPGKADARIGSWTRDKIRNYFKDKPHRLVSNGKEECDMMKISIHSRQPSDYSSLSIPRSVLS